MRIFLRCFSELYSSSVRRNTTTAFLFPGQGNHAVGMTSKLVAELPEAITPIFQTAQRVLGYDLQSLCLHGPEHRLKETLHSQPAVVVASLAAVEYLRHKNPNVVSSCTGVAGFSVGELTALIFAGSLSLEQGLQLIKVRAEGMHSACLQTPSTMLTLIGLDEHTVTGLCSDAKHANPDGEICIAIYLFPKGFVVAGSLNAVEYVGEKAAALGGQLKEVRVSGAFHSSLMKPAVPKFQVALEKAEVSMPNVAVYSNVTGQPYSSVDEIKTNLLEQITKPVLWEKTIRNMLQNSDSSMHFVEIGPGKSSKTILQRIDKTAFKKCENVEA